MGLSVVWMMVRRCEGPTIREVEKREKLRQFTESVDMAGGETHSVIVYGVDCGCEVCGAANGNFCGVFRWYVAVLGVEFMLSGDTTSSCCGDEER